MASSSRSKLDDDDALEPPTASASTSASASSSASTSTSTSPSMPREPLIATRIHSPSPSPPLDAAAAAANGSRHQTFDAEDDADDVALSQHPTAIPRKPMHRSISVPLSHRMGDLRHPRPLKSMASFSGISGDEAQVNRPQLLDQTPPASLSSLHSALLRHRPHRSSTMPARLASRDDMSPAALAHLVLDTLQLPIAHLLHVMPPHLLDASHETLSATSLAMPVTTVEALLEAFRSINWVCDAFAEDTPSSRRSDAANEVISEEQAAATPSPSESRASSTRSSSAAPTTTEVTTPSSDAKPAHPTFDLFELAQRAADVVSGQASDKSIDLVLSCTSSKAPALLQAMAQGDAGPVRCVLIHALSRYLEFVPASSSVELDVLVDDAQEHHRIAFSLQARMHTSAPAPRLEHFQPDASVLQLAGAEWIASDETSLKGKLVFPHALAAAKPVLDDDGHHAQQQQQQQRAERQRFLPRLTLAEEPTASQLANFGAFELNGKRAALHASEDSVFARNLTTLLKQYGCEVTRIAPSVGARTAVALADGRPAFVRYESKLAKSMSEPRSEDGGGVTTQAVLDPVTGVPVTLSDGAAASVEQESRAPSSVPMTRGGTSDSGHSTTSTVRASSNGGNAMGEMEAFSFLMVDDDIDVLQQKLLRMRSALPILRTAMGEHAESNGHAESSRAHTRTHAIIFFTSLSNFRSVRDVVQPIMEGAVQALGGTAAGAGAGDGATNALLPEIVVIPKPAGARRVLTALHTAVHKPLVDPFFAPIATSPMSPHLWEARMNWSSSATGSRHKTPSQQHSPSAQRTPPPQRTPPKAAEQQERTPPSASSTQSRASAGAATPTSPTRKATPPSPQRSPNRRAPGMRIPNFPRTDPASVMASAPSLPTPLRQQLSTDSEGDSEADDTLSSLQQHGGPSSSQPRSPLAPLRSKASPVTSASPSPSGNGPPSSSGSTGLLVTPALSHRSSTGSSSPMPVEALEYFSETAARLGGSGASGMMIQSTDGRPAGIFFQPKRSNSNYSSLSHGSGGGGGGRRSGATSRGGSTGAATPVGPDEQAPPAPGSASSAASATSSGGSHRRGGRKSGGEAGSPPATVTSPRARPLTEILDEAGTQAENPSQTPKRRVSSPGKGTHAETPSSRAPAPADGGVTPLTSSNLEQVEGALPALPPPSSSQQVSAPKDPSAEGAAAAAAARPDVSSSNFTMRNAGRPADEPQSSAPTESATTATSTTTDWQSAPPGTLFAPQVDIGQVLAARTPPLATPISHATTGSVPPLPPLPASLQTKVEERRDSVKREEGFEMSRGPTPATTPPPTLAPRAAAASVQQPARKNSTVVATSEQGSGDAPHVSGASRPQNVSAASSGARPSAQPQSGLLIGAGFAPTARRGAPSRRAAVREKVLPPIKVLIVEDNPINQRILKQFMNRKRIQSEVAVNGREAVDKWATGGFHLILMDIQLPVMDGIEATKEIRRREMSEGVVPPTSPLGGPAGGGVGRLGESTPTPSASSTSLTPSAAVGAMGSTNATTTPSATTPFRASVIIVALTASSLNSDKVAALSSGCNDFLQKPVSLVWLEKKIIEWGSMQYIVGYLGDEKRLLASGAARKGSMSTGGTAGASLDVRRAFGKAPDVMARQLASKLHLPKRGAK